MQQGPRPASLPGCQRVRGEVPTAHFSCPVTSRPPVAPAHSRSAPPWGRGQRAHREIAARCVLRPVHVPKQRGLSHTQAAGAPAVRAAQRSSGGVPLRRPGGDTSLCPSGSRSPPTWSHRLPMGQGRGLSAALLRLCSGLGADPRAGPGDWAGDGGAAHTLRADPPTRPSSGLLGDSSPVVLLTRLPGAPSEYPRPAGGSQSPL